MMLQVFFLSFILKLLKFLIFPKYFKQEEIGAVLHPESSVILKFHQGALPLHSPEAGKTKNHGGLMFNLRRTLSVLFIFLFPTLSPLPSHTLY